MDKLFAPTIRPITIEDEMQKSYLDYAMSVIVSRALPDVRDGLKPVHRRILFAQNQMGNDWNRKYLKSARVVGDVMGKYHPHGDSSIYEAAARMAQDFSLRLPLEDGQGNFGSMDGDSPAAMRYTEIRLSRAGSAMLQDIEEDTVDFRPNYDGSENEPIVLPTRIPNLLANGSGGIAVGMATNIPPHNLGELIDGCLFLIDNPMMDAGESSTALQSIILGPDYPTGGIIMGRQGIVGSHLAGRGSIVTRGKAVIEQKGETKNNIIITEVPYQVNKAKLVEQIAELVKEKIVDDISDLRDESSREGVRVVIELKRGANADVVLNQLYKHTNLQTSFGVNMVVLDQGLPRLMGIPEVLKCFIAHREEVISRRTRFRLGKARDRAHILVGLAVSVENIDDVIALIRNAPDGATAKEQLMSRNWSATAIVPLLELLGEAKDATSYRLSALQAQAILDLRLQRLTGLEREKILEEALEIAGIIKELLQILSDRATLLALMKTELVEVKELFATPRRTMIEAGGADVNMEDLITPEDMVVTISSDGYVKRVPLATFRAQRRGGKGKAAAQLRENEEMSTLFVANTHDPVLFFTSLGNVFKLKCYDLPQANATSRGKAFVNLLALKDKETIAGVIAIPRDESVWNEHYLVFSTEKGMVRKTPLVAYANVRSSGIYGMGLNDGDTLLDVHLYHEPTGADVLISSKEGQAVRFSAAGDALRAIASRTSTGVRGMTLKGKDNVMAMRLLTPNESHVLTVTANGYGKLTVADDYPKKGRGTMGVISIQTTSRNGDVVAALPVSKDDQLMIATSDGQLIRMNVGDISVMGRNTQGVRLFSTDGSKVTLVTRVTSAMLNAGEDEEEVVESGQMELAPVEELDAVVETIAEEPVEVEETKE